MKNITQFISKFTFSHYQGDPFAVWNYENGYGKVGRTTAIKLEFDAAYA